MHHTSPHVASWFFLLLIPLMIWGRVRRARRAAQASDFWFEPEGAHFIYHPFGRFGTAYLVSPAARTAIRARSRIATQLAAVVFIAAAAGPILLLSVDIPLYMQWRPVIVPVRLGLIAALIAGGLLWRALVIRPLYANAPLAPRRISNDNIRIKQAASRSWWALVLTCIMFTSLALVIGAQAYHTGNTAYMIYAALISVLALLNIRAMATKWRHRGT